MATWHVATTGNNSNNGTSLVLAKRNISNGQALLSAGDTLEIHGGDYAEGILNPISGTDDAHHTIVKGTASETVRILGSVNDLGQQAVTIYGVNYLTLDNLTIVGAQDGGAGTADLGMGVGQRFGPVTHHILFNNLIIHHSGGVFVAADTGSNYDITFRSCTIYHSGFPWAGGSNPHGHNLYIEHCVRCIIEDCDIYDGESHGIHVFSQSGLGVDDLIVRRCKLHDNGSSGITLSCGTNQIAYNNLIYGNCVRYASAGARTYDGAVSCAFYNNTVYGNLGTYWGIWIQSGTTCKVRNNICYGNSIDVVKDDGVTSTLSNNSTANPSFSDAPNDDFTLQSGSIADGTGVDLSSIFTTDYLNASRTAPWDLGAYLFGSVPAAALFEPFNYTTNANLAAQNGGTRWTGVWVNAGSGTMTVAASGIAGNCLQSQITTGNGVYNRAFTTISTDIISWYQYISTIPNSLVGFFFTEGGNGRFYVDFDSDGFIKTNFTTLAAYSINTWYKIDVQLDAVNQPSKFRVSINGGTYSAWINAFDTMLGIDGCGVEDLATNAHTFLLDSISNTTISLFISDVTTVTETLTVVQSLKFSISDSFTVSDTITALIDSLKPSVADTVTLTEAKAVIITALKAETNDVITVSESVTAVIPIFKPLVSEPITVSDTPTLFIINSVGALNPVGLDTVLVTEAVSLSIPTLFINKTETITVSDSAINYISTVYFSVADAVDISDGPVVISPTRIISVLEVVTVTESVPFLSTNDQLDEYYRRYLNDVFQ